MFHSVNGPHFVYPLISRWTFERFHVLAIVTAVDTRARDPCWVFRQPEGWEADVLLELQVGKVSPTE